LFVICLFYHSYGRLSEVSESILLTIVGAKFLHTGCYVCQPTNGVKVLKRLTVLKEKLFSIHLWKNGEYNKIQDSWMNGRRLTKNHHRNSSGHRCRDVRPSPGSGSWHNTSLLNNTSLHYVLHTTNYWTTLVSSYVVCTAPFVSSSHWVITLPLKIFNCIIFKGCSLIFSFKMGVDCLGLEGVQNLVFPTD